MRFGRSNVPGVGWGSSATWKRCWRRCGAAGKQARIYDRSVSWTEWAVVGVAAVVVIYACAVGALVIAGRRGDARALASFIPDCLVLVKRLLGDPRVPRRRKLLLVALLVYLASPIDLVPDFVPVAGQLDDAIVVALVLRALVRGGGEPLLREHWPGSERSLAVIRRLIRNGPSATTAT
jgi:uncharacterized membrane protein YkvA (DUF1232 family)